MNPKPTPGHFHHSPQLDASTSVLYVETLTLVINPGHNKDNLVMKTADKMNLICIHYFS